MKENPTKMTQEEAWSHIEKATKALILLQTEGVRIALYHALKHAETIGIDDDEYWHVKMAYELARSE